MSPSGSPRPNTLTPRRGRRNKSHGGWLDYHEQFAAPLAQLVGAFAFESARHLWRMREPQLSELPRLTDRQRDCVVWAARGKSDWEISRILGLSQDTVIQHVKQARERYGVGKRTLLAVHALFDGTISFIDVLKR